MAEALPAHLRETPPKAVSPLYRGVSRYVLRLVPQRPVGAGTV